MTMISKSLYIVAILSMSALLLLPACGQSDKEKAMDLADQYEALVDKYAEQIKESKESGDFAATMEILQKMQEEAMEILTQMEGFENLLTEEDLNEVKARFEEISKKFEELLGI